MMHPTMIPNVRIRQIVDKHADALWEAASGPHGRDLTTEVMHEILGYPYSERNLNRIAADFDARYC